MRIETVTFKNLNSLIGCWTVDFTHPDYVAEGIFAITGPTGAGKTTILDAICLALYGRTPRLDKINKQSNEIMSRQTGDCSAELTFSTAAGRYRCAWSQRRARNKASESLQPHRHEIADADTGALLAEKISDTARVVEEKTGMSFGQFTRSMLLAQGDFAAFLQAPPDQRTAILEQITGAEIYSTLSQMAHERNRDEQSRLRELKAEAQGIVLLTRDEEQALDRECDALARLQQRQRACLDALRAAREWRTEVDRLDRDHADVERQWRDFEARRQAFAPKRARLDLARKAMELDGAFSRLTSLREQQTRELQELNNLRQAAPTLKAQCDARRREQDQAEQRWREARQTQQEQAQRIRRARDLDAGIKSGREQETEQHNRLEGLEKERGVHADRIAALQQELRACQEARDDAEKYLNTHSKDQDLAERIVQVREKATAFRSSAEAAQRTKAALEAALTEKERADQALRHAEAAFQTARERLDTRRKEREDREKALAGLLEGKRLSDWRESVDALKTRVTRLEEARRIHDETETLRRKLATGKEKRDAENQTLAALEPKIVEATAQREATVATLERLEKDYEQQREVQRLEEKRSRLRDGDPCPLCGALDHPYVRGNVPTPDATEEELKVCKAQLHALDKQLSAWQREVAGSQKALALHEEALGRDTEAMKAGETQCAALLEALGVEAAALPTRIEKTRADIAAADKRLREADESRQALDALTKVVEAAQQEAAEADTVRTAARHAVDVARQKVADLENTRQEQESAAMALQHAINELLTPWALDGVVLSNMDERLDALQQRLDQWRYAQQRRDEASKRGAEVEGRLQTEQALLDRLAKEGAEARARLAALAGTLDTMSRERNECFGDRDPDREEKRQADAVTDTEKVFDTAAKAATEADRRRRDNENACRGMEERLQKLAESLAQEEAAFAGAYARAGFADEGAFRNAYLTPELRADLGEQADVLTRDEAALTARRAAVREALERERAKNVTVQPLDTLQQAEAAAEAAREETQRALAVKNEQRDTNRNNQARLQSRREAMEKQQRECARWAALNTFIGSHDGKKYRNFAQGLTFELMVSQANRQLRRMTDRYLLVHDKASPLELNVIDSYQAGEVRPTKNLSGGESFLVSLALALGLSHIAGARMRVDSLFLDEGFGTLDEDALETALEALGALRETGKVIGVISHVPALKERINTQIQVLPRTGGHSTLDGPGVTAG